MDTNPAPPPISNQGLPSPPEPPLPSTPAAREAKKESTPSPLAQVFVGPEGLSAGARWLIYLAMAAAVLLLCGTLTHYIPRARSSLVWSPMLSEIGMMLAAILPGFVMARIERRPFGEFGLPAKGAFGRNFWAGALWGIGALTVLMLALRLLGVFSFGSLDVHGGRIFKFGAYYAVFFLVAALFEDFLMRGYSQWVLTKAINFWPAAALLSVLFGVIHIANSGETKVGLVGVVAIGFFFCLTLRRTGTLWWAIGFHIAWDWGESYLYSVPDSGSIARGHLLHSSLHGPVWLTGGSVGPEGSYLLFVLIAVLWVLFSHAYPEVKYGRQRC